jgi:hypothetical protein
MSGNILKTRNIEPGFFFSSVKSVSVVLQHPLPVQLPQLIGVDSIYTIKK